jgi:hypothetical protein
VSIHVYRVLVGKPEVKMPPGRLRYRWEDNIKTDLTETEWEDMDWTDVAQDKNKQWAHANKVKNLWFPHNGRNFFTS